MKRSLKVCLAAIMLAIPLAGCWDLKDVQEVGYVTALGFDYADGQYVVCVQMIDFSSVAKAELAGHGQSPVWVGIGRGETIAEAIGELHKTEQMPLFFGHVGALVMGEQLLKRKDLMVQVYEFKSRNYEIRSTAWIYGTRAPLDKLFSLTSIFGGPPIMSVLHQPRESFKQYGHVKPMTIREFDVRLGEPAITVLLPCLSIDSDDWRDGESRRPASFIDGAFVIENRNYRMWLSNEQLTALPWIMPDTYTTLLELNTQSSKVVVLQLGSPKVRVTPRVRGGNAEYSLSVTMDANFFVDTTSIPEDEIERMAEEKVKREIEKLFEFSVKHDIDLLGLEEALYRKRVRDWKMLKERGAHEIGEDSLKEINVDIRLKRTGKIKERIMMESK